MVGLGTLKGFVIIEYSREVQIIHHSQHDLLIYFISSYPVLLSKN